MTDPTSRDASNGVADRIHQSEEQFRILVQGVTDYAIFMLDVGGHVASWNAGAQRIKGYRAEEIIGEHFSRFYTAEDRERGLPGQGLATARKEGRWEQEGLRVRKDGSKFWAHAVIDAIRNDGGEIIGFAKVTRDITERKAGEKALEEARDQLLQAQKLEALGQLTGGVAHDFNNILTAVLGSLELVRKRLPYDPKITPLLDNALEGGRRGAALTRRMLAFARHEELAVSAVDVPSLVRGMMNFLQSSIGPSIRIETEFPSTLPRARTDAGQLEAALLNLVINARDAISGTGSITVSARRDWITSEHPVLARGEYVVLSVSDTGQGMDAETAGRAAEPFFTTKGVGKGTGLGLSMVHGLTAQSGGQLRIVSTPGQGTEIQLWLPSDQPETGELEGQTHRLTVLVVDDDPLVLRNTTALLEDLGYGVVQACSGTEALHVLQHDEAVSAVVSDLAMPTLSGASLCSAARELRPGLPYVIMTGVPDFRSEVNPDVVRVSKPFTQDQLAQAVEAVLAQKETP